MIDGSLPSDARSTNNKPKQKGSNVDNIQETKPLQFRVPPSDNEIDLAYALDKIINLEKRILTQIVQITAGVSEFNAFKNRVRDHVIETAIEKDWCVDGTNRHLTACGLDEWDGPNKNYDVTFTVVYTVSTNVEDCADEEEAAQRAEDMFDSSDLRYESYDEFTIQEIDES